MVGMDGATERREYRGIADLSSAGGRQGMSSSFKERINVRKEGDVKCRSYRAVCSRSR